ncbi:MAG: TolC family protein, partial [Bacteroides sp.]
MKRLFYILTCCSLPLMAQAQEVYTLKSCLENGLQNNYSLRITQNTEQISKNNATLGNAGYLPTLDLSAGYKGTIDNTESKLRETGEISKENGVFDQALSVGANLNWTLFDGFNITTNYKRLKELERQGATNTRIAIEDFVAGMAAEYYNFVQQKIRLKNFRYATSLSKERLRIVEERYHIGNFSRLDYQQAKVDFNSDSAKYMKQQELLNTSRIRLNELMANPEVDKRIRIKDSLIQVNTQLTFDELWNATLATNAVLLKAEQNTRLAQLDYKSIQSRNYPYLKLNTGYGYTLNKYDISANSRRSNLG